MSSYFRKFPKMLYDLTNPLTTTYETGGKANIIVAKDIIRRVALKSKFRENAFAYDSYDIKDGDRPDIVAEKFFGDSKLAWIILVTNEIHDIYEDWCLSERELKKVIERKYGGPGPWIVYGTDTHYAGYRSYYYPVYLDMNAAIARDKVEGGAGGKHDHTFTEYPNVTFYMPNAFSNHALTSAPTSGDFKLYTSNSSADGIHHYEKNQTSGDTKIKVIVNNEVGATAITNKQYEEERNETKRQIKILRRELVQDFIEEFESLVAI